jgi:hypothetical protein
MQREDIETEIEEIEREIEQLTSRGVRVIPKSKWEDSTFQPPDDALTLEYLYFALKQMRSARHAKHNTSS